MSAEGGTLFDPDFGLKPRWVAGGPHRPLEERFWEKVDKRGPDECWEWLAMRSTHGYGLIRRSVEVPSVHAHRIAYELCIGPIPEGLTLDHLCRNRGCVNPGHLEPVTNRENVLRGEGPFAKNARKTHCPKGHPYDAANTIRKRGQRKCRECGRQDSLRRYYRRKGIPA